MRRRGSRKTNFARERLSDAPRSAFAPLAQHQVVSQAELEKRHAAKKRRRSKKSVDLEEAREQKRFVEWARERGLEINHQNNGANSKQRRIHLYQMGCTAGAADLLIFDRLPKRPEARGLAIEFKSSNGEQSEAQIGWEARITELGWVYHVVFSSNEAKEVCRWYGL